MTCDWRENFERLVSTGLSVIHLAAPRFVNLFQDGLQLLATEICIETDRGIWALCNQAVDWFIHSVMTKNSIWCY